MITKPIDPKNIELIRVVKAECFECSTVEYIEVTAISDAQITLHKMGWRSIDDGDSITDPVCNHCIAQLKD